MKQDHGNLAKLMAHTYLPTTIGSPIEAAQGTQADRIRRCIYLPTTIGSPIEAVLDNQTVVRAAGYLPTTIGSPIEACAMEPADSSTTTLSADDDRQPH